MLGVCYSHLTRQAFDVSKLVRRWRMFEFVVVPEPTEGHMGLTEWCHHPCSSSSGSFVGFLDFHIKGAVHHI